MSLDSLKYYDSIISLKNELIEIQNKSIDDKKDIIDSLDNVIGLKRSKFNFYDESLQSTLFTFFNDLKKLMISQEILVFVCGCIILGFIIISADWATYAASTRERKKSLLGLKYIGRKKIIFQYLLWGAGSGLLAYISSSLGMFKCTFMSCSIIAITWPVLLPRIIKKLNTEEEDEVQQPRSN